MRQRRREDVHSLRKLAAVVLTMATAAALPWVILFGVNATMGEPPTRFDREQCTRHCHDRGCRHQPVLPPSLTSSAGLFGDTVRGLHWLGARTGLGPRRGYGVANLLIFCILWPGLMLALVGLATNQWLDLRNPRQETDGG